MKKQFLVIGLGRFGTSVARTLTEEGHSVVGIDRSEDRIQRVSEEIADVIKCDATDADLLESMGVPERSPFLFFHHASRFLISRSKPISSGW